MNDLTAAIGLVQLRRVESFIEKRREIEREYDQAFAAIPWIRTPPPAPSGSVPYFYWIQTESQIRDRLATYLQQLEIYTTFRYWPIHKMELYQDGGRYPGAEEAAARTLLLPLHQSLNDHDIGSIIASIEAFRT